MKLKLILLAGMILGAVALFSCHMNNPSTLPPVHQAEMQTLSTTTSAPKHLMVGIYGCGYVGPNCTAVPISTQAKYITWAYANTSVAAEYKAYGVHTTSYVQVWRSYKDDSPTYNYNDLSGTNSSARAVNCSGSLLYTTAHGGGYLGDVRKSNMVNHVKYVTGIDWSNYRAGTLDAEFLDNTGTIYGYNYSPCNFNAATWFLDVSKVTAQIPHPIWMNLLNDEYYIPSTLLSAESTNTIGALCEACYISNYSSVPFVTGKHWVFQENTEIASVLSHKVFWDYLRNTDSANSTLGRQIRVYGLASFLLTYDYNYAMIQTLLSTTYSFPVMPEWGLVPQSPLTTYPTLIGYQHGNLYGRQFGACYFGGANLGACAVVVNPSTSSASIPWVYPHSMVLYGGGVTDHGTVGFSGSALRTLGPSSAAILFNY